VKEKLILLAGAGVIVLGFGNCLNLLSRTETKAKIRVREMALIEQQRELALRCVRSGENTVTYCIEFAKKSFPVMEAFPE